MIKKITIKNFQSHKESVLELAPGVNVIKGSSDSGKTAIIRALNWVCTNKPRGDAFHRETALKAICGVTVEFDDCVVTRERKGAAHNLYKLGDEEFRAFNQDVPPAVEEAVNLKDVNRQGQMDAPYLLTLPSGQVASHLNDLVDLNEIGDSLTRINSSSRKTKKQIDHLEQNIEDEMEEYKTYEGLDALEVLIVSAEKADKKEKENHEIRYTLGTLIDLVDSATETKAEYTWVSKAEKEYAKAEKVDTEIRELSQDFVRLRNLIEEIESIEICIVPDVDALLEEATEVDGLLSVERAEFAVLNSLISDYAKAECDLSIKKIKVDALEREWEDEFPNECPLCGATNES